MSWWCINCGQPVGNAGIQPSTDGLARYATGVCYRHAKHADGKPKSTRVGVTPEPIEKEARTSLRGREIKPASLWETTDA